MKLSNRELRNHISWLKKNKGKNPSIRLINTLWYYRQGSRSDALCERVYSMAKEMGYSPRKKRVEA